MPLYRTSRSNVIKIARKLRNKEMKLNTCTLSECPFDVLLEGIDPFAINTDTLPHAKACGLVTFPKENI